MTTVGLPVEIEQRLDSLSRLRHRSKSDLVKEALEAFFAQKEDERDSEAIGKEYLGRFGGGAGFFSTVYKQRIKDKLIEKYQSRSNEPSA
jgi:hypothetical protein